MVLDPHDAQYPFGQLIENPVQTSVGTLSASESAILQNSVHWSHSDPTDPSAAPVGSKLYATFMPAEGTDPPAMDQPAKGALSLAQAEAILGVDHFNWLQQITYTPPTLQPVTFKGLDLSLSSAPLLKETPDGFEEVAKNEAGQYVLDTDIAPIVPFYREAPFLDPIVPTPDTAYTQTYLRGFIIQGNYAYVAPMNSGPEGEPPPADAYYYYYNEPLSSYNGKPVSPSYNNLAKATTPAALLFYDQPAQPSFTDPFNPSVTISAFTSSADSFLGFLTSLVGVTDDTGPGNYKIWTDDDYMTNFTWDSNALTNTQTGVSGTVNVEGFDDFPGGNSEPPITSGGVFGVEPANMGVTASSLFVSAIPDENVTMGQTIVLTASASDPTDGRSLSFSLGSAALRRADRPIDG